MNEPLHSTASPMATPTPTATPPTRSDDSQLHAPWLSIPSRSISAIEHPCIVKNVDKGIASLGGPVKLSKGLRSNVETTTDVDNNIDPHQLVSVSLRPDDPFAKRLLSTIVTTNDLLLKVTVPKRTGRKRKRGSSGPFLTEKELADTANGTHATTKSPNKTTYVDASTIYRTLQDNASTYKVAFAGLVDETHRFRTMPDLQYTAGRDETMANLRDHILPKNYTQTKNFKLNTEAGPDLTKSVGPSAEFFQMPIAYNYRFQQNTYVKYTDAGVVNLQRSLTYNSYNFLKPTEDGVPTGPSPNLPPEESLTPYLQTLIAQIRAELDKRPIITRHLLYNKLGWDKRNRLRQAAVYCGYFFESGPWREALVQWGVDPRTDPKYRKYQTVSFLSYLKTGKPRHHSTFDDHIQKLSQMTKKELETQHTFDGKSVSNTGNLFQFCDITDPVITRILATEDIRTTCAPTFQGWYHVGTWAKATVILKDKMNIILGGGIPDDEIYTRILEWPEAWDDRELAVQYKAELSDRQTTVEGKKELEVMNNVRWAARNPRYAFEKMEAAELQQTETDDYNDGDAEDFEVPEDMTEVPDTAEAILNEGEKAEEYPDLDEDNDDEELQDDDDDIDAEGEEVDDYDSDTQVMPLRAAGAGPAPFGGLYSV